MFDSVFSDNFPEVKTDIEIENIIKLFSQYDPYYVVSGSIKDRKNFFNKLWNNFNPYADKNFKTEIKTNFHQRTREMYMGNLLLNKGLSIKSKNDGPDFIINDNIYIECVATTRGDPKKPDSVPEMFIAKDINEICVQNVPVDKMILRITQAIKNKAIIQYKKRENKKWFNKNYPFIIAINTGDLDFLQDYLGIPLIIKALFGLEFLQISKEGNKSFSWREKVKKESDTVFVNYFANKEYNFISGIIFSDKRILYYLNNDDDSIFINNPHASNPIPIQTFAFLDKWKAKQHENEIELKYIKKSCFVK